MDFLADTVLVKPSCPLLVHDRVDLLVDYGGQVPRRRNSLHHRLVSRGIIFDQLPDRLSAKVAKKNAYFSKVNNTLLIISMTLCTYGMADNHVGKMVQIFSPMIPRMLVYN